MENLLSTFGTIIITTVIASVGTYVAAIYNLKTRVAVLEARMKDIENDIKKDGEKIDKVTEILFEMREDLASIKATLDIRKKERK